MDGQEIARLEPLDGVDEAVEVFLEKTRSSSHVTAVGDPLPVTSPARRLRHSRP